jgi:tetratricopeptide (TPR) repeat protein
MNADCANRLGRASALFHAGRWKEALPAYEDLLRRHPNLPNSWFNLAMLQRDARRYRDALASYRRALDLNIEAPEEVHLQRGVIYADDLGDSDSAEREIRAALVINADYLPALLNLGTLYEDRGIWHLAAESYDCVLRIDPSNAIALARKLGLSSLIGLGDPMLARVRESLISTHSTLSDRADLGFALGAALDRIDYYDEAFRAYEAANGASKGIARQRGYIYDPILQEEFTNQLIAAFPNHTPKIENERRAPLFICGMFRSGSTLIEQMLSRHPQVVAGGELDALPSLIRESLTPYPETVASLTPTDIERLGAGYLAEVEQRWPLNSVLTDKRPDNFLHIGLIKHLFPNAKIIHTIRDPRDLCLSIYFLHASEQLNYATDMANIVHFLSEHNRLMNHWKFLFPGDILSVSYDNLVLDPTSAMAAVLSLCSLEWDDAVLESRQTGGAVRTASNWQVRQPLYSRSSGRWQNYRRYLEPYSFPEANRAANAENGMHGIREADAR